MDKKDVLFISHLRNDARMNLTTLSKKTKIPISTLYDRLKAKEKSIITRHTSLIDFAKMGYGCRANMTLKVERDCKQKLCQFLLSHESVNTLFKINNGYDYMIEVIFRNIRELEDFLEAIESRYKILAKNIHYIIEDLARERFMTDTNTFCMDNQQNTALCR